MKTTLSAITMAMLLGASSMAQAQWSVNVGAINVNPDTEVSHIDQAPSLALNVDDDTQLGIVIDYAFDDNWGLELVAATPFDHDVKGQLGLGGADLGDVKHLPPTLFAQYHFGKAGDKFRPFVGLGVNYTTFFDEQAGQDLKDTLGTDDVELELDDSWGLAAQVGVNYAINEKWGVNAMVSYIDIDSDATIYANGAEALTVDIQIDPVVAMFGVRYSF